MLIQLIVRGACASEDEVAMEKRELNEIVRGTVLEQNARIGDHHSRPRLGTCAFSRISKSVGRWRLTEHTGQGQTRSGR